MAEANTREQMLWGKLITATVGLTAALAWLGFAPTDGKRVMATCSFAFSYYGLELSIQAMNLKYFARPQIEDERDRLIELKGKSSAHDVLKVGIALIFFELDRKNDNLSVPCLAGWLFYLFLLSVIVRCIRQIRLYHFHEWWIPDSWGRGRRRRMLQRMEERIRQKQSSVEKPEA